MRRLNLFRPVLILFAILMTLVLTVSIGSLLVVSGWREVLACLASEEMQHALFLTAATGVISTVLVMAAAIPIAYVFSRFTFPGYRLARAVLYLPIAFPELVLGFCLLLFFGNPLARELFDWLGLEVVFTRNGIVVAQFFSALPFAVRVIKTAFDDVDPQLEHVSRSLGFTQAKTLLLVSLPLAASGLKAATAIAFARSVGAFGSVLVLAGGAPMDTETLPVALYRNLSYGNLDMAVTAGLLLVVVAFVGIYVIESMEHGSSADRLGL